ncbi:TonB-dependent siderophore receptor [Diaphorobacter caeni]|uniref:TonB-dependent siderophore receptor n=1 Tax=Diaphorobacter caeni TaxID=2784387 RepID=UPI00188FA0FC|nr:TonB-dependent siderophore receptor [Diaphorobacter caeni]MBF5005101.1 TonB-dependent siderophore receptor [Diaphorobacter caeni]
MNLHSALPFAPIAAAVLMAMAPAAHAVPVDIPAGPLGQALSLYAARAGVVLSFPSGLTEGLRTAGIKGDFSIHAGFDALLVGSGLIAVSTPEGSFTLRKNAASEKQAQASAPAPAGSADGALPTVTVTATPAVGAETNGTSRYVAKRASSGTKTDTPLIAVPQSISVITRDQIDEQAVTSVREALRYTPGLVSEYRGAGGTRYDTILYRGFGGGINYDYSYLDGMRLLGANYAIPQVDPYHLERVDVLRGPASVLYGQGTPGGMINLVSKMPTPDPLHEVQVQLGTKGWKQLGFDLGGALNADGTLSYRLTGVGHDGDSQVKHQTDRRAALAGGITWQPDADTSLTLLMRYQHDPEGGYYGFLPAVGTVKPLPDGSFIPRNFFDGSPAFDQFRRTQSSIGYQFEKRIDDQWSLHSSLRFLHVGTDYDSVFTSGVNVSNPSNPQLVRRAIFNNASYNAITADNRAQYSFKTGDLSHKLLFGIDYQRLHYNEAQGMGNAPSLSIPNPDYAAAITRPAMSSRSRQELDQIGLYVQDQIQWDRWTWLVGVRQDWAGNDRAERISGTDVKQSDHAFTGRIGLVYQMDSGVAPYVSYSRSFQPVADADAAGRLFKPTTGEQVEVGVKYQPPGSNTLLTAAAYQLTQNNVLTTDPNNTAYSIQTGQVRTRGVELEARASVTRSLDIIASYTHADNVNTRSNTAQDKHPTYVPDQSAGLWGSYTVRDGALAGLGVSAGVRYTGRSWADAGNTMRVPDYTLLDAAVRYDLGVANPALKGTTLALNVTNLTDKTFVSACATATKCFYGAGRTVRATMTYKW